MVTSLLAIAAAAKPEDPFSIGDDTNCSAACTPSVGQRSSSLPNVLLLSDSIGATGTGYYTNVRALLGNSSDSVSGAGAVGNAAVVHTGGYGRGRCGTSYGVVACAPLWVGGGGWDVIHFNWGLHDICASMYAPVSLAEYEANMEELYSVLKAALAPNGTLIWSTTTPVPPSYKARNNSDVVALNALMQRKFGPGSEHPDVLMSDLYGAVVSRCARDPAAVGYPQHSDCDVLQSRGVHFSDAGKQFTAIVTAGAIVPYL